MGRSGKRRLWGLAYLLAFGALCGGVTCLMALVRADGVPTQVALTPLSVWGPQTSLSYTRVELAYAEVARAVRNTVLGRDYVQASGTDEKIVIARTMMADPACFDALCAQLERLSI